MSGLPLLVTVWVGDRRAGPLGAPDDISAVFRANAVFDAEFTVAADHPRLADLLAEGSRAVVVYRPEDGEPVIGSGEVEDITSDDEPAGEEDDEGGPRTFRVVGDWDDVFRHTLGWPNPTATITEQGQEGAYFTRSGPMETVLKDIVRPAVTRTGKPLTIPTSGGRGGQVKVQVRMHPLADRLFPLVEQKGLVVDVVQADPDQPDRVLQVRTPITYHRTLTEGSGAIRQVTTSESKPTVTRVVVGAGGEGVARVFREYIDDALELRFGGGGGRRLVREQFVDARDLASDWGQAIEAHRDAVAEVEKAIAERTTLGRRLADHERNVRHDQRTYDTAPAGNPGKQAALDNLNESKTDRDAAQEDYDDAVQAAAQATQTASTAADKITQTRNQMLADMAERAAEVLAEGAPTVDYSFVLSETGDFRFGKRFRHGDFVSLRPAGLATAVVDRIREVEIGWDPENGLTVEPRVGAVENSTTTRDARTVGALLRRDRDRSTR